EAFEAARILHGRAGSLKHPVDLGDLLLDAHQLFAVGAAAALHRGEFLLQLKAADLLLAEALGEAERGGAGDQPRAAQAERGPPTVAGKPRQHGKHAPKMAVCAQSRSISPKSDPAARCAPALCAPQESGVNAA